MDYEPLGESDAAFAPIGSIHGGFPWDFHHISASPIWIDPGDCSRKPFLHVSIVKTSELPNKWSMSSMNHPGLSEKRLPHATLKFTGLFWLSPWNYHNGNCHNLRVYYISFWDTTLQIVGDLEVGPWSRGWPHLEVGNIQVVIVACIFPCYQYCTLDIISYHPQQNHIYIYICNMYTYYILYTHQGCGNGGTACYETP